MGLSFAVTTIHFLGGVVFVLSAYVIARHVRDWKLHGLHLLPLHVWVVSISYNFLVLSLMWRGPENDIAFFFGATGLLMGIYSLWALSQYQQKRRLNK